MFVLRWLAVNCIPQNTNKNTTEKHLSILNYSTLTSDLKHGSKLIWLNQSIKIQNKLISFVSIISQ